MHDYTETLKKLTGAIDAGGEVRIHTMTNVFRYTKAWKGKTPFKIGADGALYAARGKGWNCIGYANGHILVGIEVLTPKKKGGRK